MRTFAGRERKAEKKKMITDDKPSTKYHRVQHHEKEDKMVFSMT
jgi:hypothetical protein